MKNPHAYKVSAGLIIIRSRNIYPRGRACQEVFLKILKKSHSAENCRTVPKMSHSLSLYIAEHTRLLPRNCRHRIRIKYHVTRVVSQSESSNTSPESSITSLERSRLEWRSLLGSRLESARYRVS